MFTTSFTGNFLETIKARASTWASKPTLTFSIVLPQGMEWVMYQEFGIDHPYVITGPNGVYFPSDIYPGVVMHFQAVIHPGLQPTHTIGTINAAMMNGPLQAAVIRSFAGADYALEGVKESLLAYVESIKEQIGEEMLLALPGTREDPPGKLGGRSASEVFLDGATVVEKD